MRRRISSSALIGRREELAVLLDGVTRAAAASPSVFLVSGDAGIGKSRLIDELERLATDSLVLRGACVDFAGAQLPYAPIIGALRAVDGDAVAAAALSLPAVVQTELGLLVPALTPPDVAFDQTPTPGADARMHEHLLALLRVLGRTVSVLLIVEDLQWADQSTRDFLLLLARTVREDRLAVVLSNRHGVAAQATLEGEPRPDALRTFLAALRLCPTAEALELEPLSETDVAVQVEAILGEPAAPDVLQAVSARSQGNPFYVEELLATPGGLSGRLPPTLLTALLTRVEGLSADCRELLTVLSAFGRPVRQPQLAAAAAIDEPALSRCLRAAADAYLIAEYPQGELGFRHALTREAVYDELLPGERQQRHGAVARALVASGEASDPGELARHWLEAGDAHAALTASLRAAAAAMEVYAFSQASEHYATALKLWPRAGERTERLADVLALAAEAAACEGDHERALEHCQAGLESLGSSAEPATQAWFHERLGRYQVWDLNHSLDCYQEALRLLPATPSAARARLHANEALALMFMVRWEEARNRCDLALAEAAAAGAKAEEGYTRAILGLLLAYLGDFAGSETHLRAARHVAEEHGRPEDVARVYLHHGEALRLSGDVAAALEMMRLGEAMAERLGVTASYGRFISISAAADLFDLGEWDDAEQKLAATEDTPLVRSEQVLFDAVAGRLAAARGDVKTAKAKMERSLCGLDDRVPTELVAYIGAVAAEVAVLGDAPELARAEVGAALRRIGARGDRVYTPWVLAAGVRAEAELAEIARARHAPDAAETAVANAERLFAMLETRLERPGEGPPPAVALAHLALARAELARVHAKAAPERWADAVAAWDALSQPYPATCARVRWAEALLCSAGNRPTATAVLEEARAFSEPRGAKLLCREIDDLARRARLTLRKETHTDPPATEPWRDLGLTVRELEVLRLLPLGITDEEIAARLFISHRTVGVHVGHILSKLDVPNRGRAANVAQRLGITESVEELPT
jgi:DNA-binding CsgD family transcriptional regulator/tetratricopeptide (TPR) repeat protein